MTIPLFNIDLFLLVFMRFTGLVLFNPIFGRTSVPNILKVGFSLLCAWIVTPTLTGVSVRIDGMVEMAVACLLEFAVGLAIGVAVDILFSVVTLAGEMVDMQMGLGMAMIYDPGSGVNMPVLGNLFNVMMLTIFLAGDAHLSLLAMMSDSFRAIAPGTGYPTAASARFLVSMGGDMLSLGLRMAIPVIAIEMIGIIAIGILMRAVPQINIFTVGIQIESLIGIAVLLISMPMIAALCSRLTSYVLEKSAELIRLMVH